MPGNPFKPAHKGGPRSAKAKSPQKVRGTKSYVPRPGSPNGNVSKAIGTPKVPRVRVTTKARKGVTQPGVRQGAQMGSPGKTGVKNPRQWEGSKTPRG